MPDIIAFDIYEYLPNKIQDLLFSPMVDELMSNVFSIANIPIEKQSLLHRDLVSVLIGKYEISQFNEILKTTYDLNDHMATTVINFLKTNLFNSIQNELNQSKVIYKQAESGQLIKTDNILLDTEEKEKIPQATNEMISYIKSLADTIKKEPEKIPPTQEVIKKEEIIEKPIIKEELKKEEVVELKKTEEKTEDLKPEPILLTAMRQYENRSEGKLNEYYKALKNNLDNKMKESENVFQPPFKTSKDKGALIESSLNTIDNSPFIDQELQNIQKNDNNQIEDTAKQPIQYNSVNYTKKDDAVNSDMPKSDDKFIDLGDL